MKYLSMLFFLFSANFLLSAQKSTIPNNYQLVYEQDFNLPQAIYDFDMSDPTAWRIKDSLDNRTLELFGKSNYQARVRSPFNISLIHHLILEDFILEVDLAQSGREYGHRDLCLFFNVQDPTNFYYVHMATQADDHANNIFLVNDAPRVKIAGKTSNGTNWGPTNSWHTARIERNTGTGTIRVYFDDMEAPVMEANDQHFVAGRIGFGSFDDTGLFDNIKIWAPKVRKGGGNFFKKE